MAVTDLPATPVDGNIAVRWVPTIAASTAPTVAEINAGSAVDLSCYLTEAPDTGGDQASIPDPRLCSLQDFEQPGKITRTMSVTYITNPTVPANNAAATTLTNGTAGYLVIRKGLAFDTAFAAAQKIDVWPVKCGLQIDANESGSVLRMNQKMFVTGPVRQSVAVAA